MTQDPFVGSPFKGLSFAGANDDKLDVPREVTVNDKWIGYMNVRVLGEVQQHHGGRITHLRFLPDTVTQTVTMVPGVQIDYGAVAVDFTDTEAGATVNMRLALKRFELQKHPNRVRVFPVIERVGDDGRTYLALDVKNSTTRPTKKLKKGPGKATPAPQGPDACSLPTEIDHRTDEKQHPPGTTN